MRELRGDLDAAVAARRHRTLSLQCLRTLSQNKWHEPSSHQAHEAPGKIIKIRLAPYPPPRPLFLFFPLLSGYTIYIRAILTALA